MLQTENIQQVRMHPCCIWSLTKQFQKNQKALDQQMILKFLVIVGTHNIVLWSKNLLIISEGIATSSGLAENKNATNEAFQKLVLTESHSMTSSIKQQSSHEQEQLSNCFLSLEKNIKISK